MSWGLLTSGFGAFVFVVFWLLEKASRKDAELKAALFMQEATIAKKAKLAADDQVIRLEKVVALYKMELFHVQADPALPGAVRERLNRLQAGPDSP